MATEDTTTTPTPTQTGQETTVPGTGQDQPTIDNEPKSAYEAITQSIAVDAGNVEEELDEEDIKTPAGQTSEEEPGEKSTTAGAETAGEDDGKGKLTEGPEAKKPGTEGDDVFDVPQGLKPRAAERYQKLVDVARQAQTESTRLGGLVHDFREVVQYSRATPEQFNELIQFSADLRSADPTAKRRALQYIESTRASLARELGEPAPGYDPLDDHPDLKSAVDDLSMTHEHALELARLRTSAKATKASTEEADKSERTRRETEDLINNGAKAVDEWVKSIQTKDVDYPAKEQALLKAASRIAKSLPPVQWVEALQEQYELINEAMNLRRPQAPTSREPQPLRAGGAAGGTKEPKTMLEAVTQSLGTS